MARRLSSLARSTLARSTLARSTAAALPLVVAAFLLFPPSAAAQSCEPEGGTSGEMIICEAVDMTVVRRPFEISEAKMSAGKRGDEEAASVVITTISEAWDFAGADTARLVAGGTEMDVSLQPTSEGKESGDVEGISIEQRKITLSRPEARRISQADAASLEVAGAIFRLGSLPGQLREVLRLTDQ